jgi:hypothetical protein
MSNGFRGPGSRCNKTVPTGGAVKGDMYPLRTGATGMVGVWQDTYSAGAAGVLILGGAHEVDCAAIAISQGDLVYWDVADGEVNKSATGNTLAGTCLATKATTAGRLVTILVNNSPGN